MPPLFTKLALIAFVFTPVSVAMSQQPAAARMPPVSAVTCADMQPRLNLRAYPGHPVRVEYPSIRTYVTPDYPTLAQKLRGVVSVCALVSETGRPTRVKIARPSGNRAIDESALRATRQTQFHPGKINGRPVAMVTELDYTFDLR